MEKESRKTAPFRSLLSFLAFHLSLGFLGGTGLVDILGSGQNVGGVFLDGGNGLHYAVFHTKQASLT